MVFGGPAEFVAGFDESNFSQSRMSSGCWIILVISWAITFTSYALSWSSTRTRIDRILHE